MRKEKWCGVGKSWANSMECKSSVLWTLWKLSQYLRFIKHFGFPLILRQKGKENILWCAVLGQLRAPFHSIPVFHPARASWHKMHIILNL